MTITLAKYSMVNEFSNGKKLELKNNCKKITNDRFVVIALFFMTYITAVRISGNIERIPSYILLAPLLIMSFYRKVNKTLLLGFFLFLVLSLIHLMFVHQSNLLKISFGNLLIDYTKYAVLLGLYILIFSSLSTEAINRHALGFFKFLIIASITMWAISILMKFGVGVDTSHEIWRLQGLTTEPSNISHFLPAFMILSVYNKKKIWIALSLLCMIITFSPTVYASVLITFIFVKFRYFEAYMSFIIAALLLGLVILLINNEAIVYSALSGIGPIGESIVKLFEGIKFAIALGEGGSNSRGLLLVSGYDFMANHNLLYSGVGFGSSDLVAKSYSPINNGDLFDSTAWASLVLWFGISAIFIYIVLGVAIVKNASWDFQSLLLVNLFVSNSINGGGVWYQILFFMMCYFKFRKSSFRTKIA